MTLVKRPSPVENAFSYLFVGAWSLWFWAQTALIAPIAAAVLVLFAIVEIAASALHIFPQFEHEITQLVVRLAPSAGSWIQVIFSLLLGCAVAGLIYHHWRLDIQVNRTNIVLSSMGTLLDEESMRVSGGSASDRITAILDALVFAVLEHAQSRGQMQASILIQRRPGENFELSYQDKGSDFDSATRLDPYDSAAANLAGQDFECGTLLYIPNTQYRHGIRIFSGPTTTDRARTSIRKSYRAFEVVPNAFQILDEENQKKVRSLLCVQVPLGPGQGRRSLAGEFAVICLSSNRRGRMRDLEYAAIKYAAAFVSFALKESARTVSTGSDEASVKT